MAFKFKISRPSFNIPLPSLPTLSNPEEEGLTGAVQGKQASAPEERFARALDKLNITYLFRYTVGAPRGLPGWKELDFLIQNGSIIYAYEVDTAFTHREKAYADVLHDAIILNDPEINSLGTLYPQVFHVHGELDLADQKSADKYAKKQFGVGLPPFASLPSLESVPEPKPADNVPQLPVTESAQKKVTQTVAKPYEQKTSAEKKIADKKKKESEEKKRVNAIKAALNKKRT
jgi:hypothetical protein